MNAKELIALNNEKREQLNKENLTYYEDMLVYIRLNFNKSEQQTEEVLLELLDHLLQAQSEGRNAQEVFGNDPKAYCQEIIGEIPGEKKAKNMTFLTYIVLQYLATMALAFGLLGAGLYYFFDLGSNELTFSIGKVLVVILIYLLLLYLFITIILKWLKSSSFSKKKPNKWLDFFIMWLVFFVIICLFVFIPQLLPVFGTEFTFHVIWVAVIGAILYLASYLFKNK